MSLLAAPVSAQQPAQDEPTDAEQELAERFAPIMMLKAQDEPCDTDGEPYRPTSVDIVLDNPQVALRQLSVDNPTVLRAPGASDLFGLGQGFFLDFPGSSLQPGCIYERDFDEFSAGDPVTIYAHIVQQPDEPGLLVVQYWFYWYYNDWNNKHESDWEGISLLFEASSVDEALASEPVAVGYSQHEGGERADWDDAKLERDGDHPVVYSSAGSHASYFGSAVYLGRGASEGFGCDNTSGPSDRYEPEVIVLPDEVADPASPLAWLEYDGRWGERQSGSFNGPTGPAVKDRWLEPIPWFDDLRPSSVVIPAGDTESSSIIGVFCGAVERGSRTLITFTISPARVFVGALLLFVIISWFVRRTNWDRVPSRPIRMRRRAGQIFRASMHVYAKSPLVFVIFGLIYLPAVAIAAALGSLIGSIPIVNDLLSVSGPTSGVNLVMALFVGSLAHLVAFLIVNVAVSDYLDHGESGAAAGIAAAVRTWQRRREVGRAFVRSYAIVAGLFFTVVGAPWAVRQLVRYQLLPEALGIEDLDGRDALARSSELVRGRWLRTAIFVGVLNASVGAIVVVVGLLLLVLATGIPLWIFSGLIALVYALVVPFAATAMTLLYGDIVSQHAGERTPDEIAEEEYDAATAG